jgi:hypothetical protein
MRLSAQTVATPYYVQKIRKLVLGIRQQCDLFCMLARLAALNAEKIAAIYQIGKTQTLLGKNQNNHSGLPGEGRIT